MDEQRKKQVREFRSYTRYNSFLSIIQKAKTAEEILSAGYDLVEDFKGHGSRTMAAAAWDSVRLIIIEERDIPLEPPGATENVEEAPSCDSRLNDGSCEALDAPCISPGRTVQHGHLCPHAHEALRR